MIVFLGKVTAFCSYLLGFSALVICMYYKTILVSYKYKLE